MYFGDELNLRRLAVEFCLTATLFLCFWAELTVKRNVICDGGAFRVLERLV